MHRVSPTGYNLPSEYTKLAEECSRYEKDDKVWIDLQASRPEPRERNLPVSCKHPPARSNFSFSDLSFCTRKRTVSETERSDVRQQYSGAKVHRESSSNRGLQVRFEIIRLRAFVSPFDDISV